MPAAAQGNASREPQLSREGLFSHEYEAELESWLQQRFGYLCVAFAVLELLHAGWSLLWIVLLREHAATERAVYWTGLGASLIGLAIVSTFLVRKLQRLETRPELLRAVTWLILTLGGLAMLEAAVARWWVGDESVGVLRRLFVWHFTACLVLPWHPRESLRPMIPLLAIWAIGMLMAARGGDLLAAAIPVLFSPLILVPGMAISAMRLSLHGRRFHSEMVGRQFVRLRKELSQARTVHESMFPAPHDDGYVRFDYAYDPARDVGGDFIHLHVGPTGITSVTLIDVTGHGIAAALTVNRLSGELERIRAENPRIQPAEILMLLNRYVHLTLARHTVYATAVAFDIDPYVGLLRFANGGHPQLLVRRAAGSVQMLDSTGMMLGAIGDDAYECEQIDVELGEGDTVIALTDGAFEAVNRRGEQLGMERLADVLRRNPAPGNWPQFLASLVERHHGGRSQDDVLIAAVTLLRLRSGTARPTATTVYAGAGAPR
ncbi:MAG: PP2C family protein-serine/threonine phosphatase [Phycisphaerales bacterium]